MTEPQNKAILEYLSKGNKLTPLDALEMFNTWSLSSRISDLKKQGHNIDKVMITVNSGKRVAQYKMI